MTQLLTDDEVVAIAVTASVPWRGLLPTVPVTTDELRRAAFRGSRSLAVRGLDDRTVAPARMAVESAPLILAFVAAEESPLAPTSSGVGVYPTSSSDVVVDVALPTGVHEFSVGTSQRAREILQGLVAQFHARGSAQGAGHLLVVLLAGRADPGAPVLVIRRDGATAHRCVIGRSGEVEVGPGVDRSDGAAVIVAALSDSG